MPLPVKIGTDQTLLHTGDPGMDNRPESAPWVTALANGEFLVHYSHLFSGGGADLDLFYQRFAAFDGAPQQVTGQTVTVNSGLAEDQATTATLADGRVVIAWHEAATAGPGDADNVRAQIIHPDGTVSLASFDVFVGTGVQGQPSVAASPDGGFAIVCNDRAVVDGQIGIRIYNAAGVQTTAFNLTPVGGVYDFNTSETREVAVTALSNGNYVVTWGRGTGDADINAQIIGPGGALVGSQFLIDASTTFNQEPSIIPTQDGGFFVAHIGASGVEGHFRDSLGSSIGGEITIGPAPTQQNAPASVSTALLHDGRVVVVWTQNVNSSDVQARILNPDGTFDSDVITVNSSTAGVQGDAQVKVLADGRFVVTWETDADGGKVQYVVYDPRTIGVDIAGTAGADNYTGSAFADQIIGQAGDDSIAGAGGSDYLSGGLGGDILKGGDGNDTLDGGGGADTLEGGDGSDTYFANLASDTVTEANAVLTTGGDDLVNYSGGAATTFTLGNNIERLTLTGTAASNGTGNGLANTLTGNAAVNVLIGLAGADRLDGGGGADTMHGGADNDTYVVDSISDTVDETSNGGAGTTDLVISSVNFSLVNSATVLGALENLTLTGTALTGTGNGSNNVITGNNAGNTLDGGALNDTLSGMNGNDSLIGGLGKDTLTGGTQNDTFTFTLKTHSAASHALADVITDFEDPGKGNDTIDLAGVYGPKLAYIHAAAFTKVGQVRINDIAGADVIVEVNTGGSLAADFSIRLKGTTLAQMAGNDFVL